VVDQRDTRGPTAAEGREVSDLSDKLLEAHVQHELASWQGDALAGTIADWIAPFFRWFGRTKLDEIATRPQILGVIERYVIDLRVSGGITELTGEMSNLVFSSKASSDTRLDEVVPPASYNEFTDKVLALEGLRRELISLVAQNAGVAAISARLAARGLLDLLSPPIALTRALDEVSLFGRLRASVLPRVETRVAAGLAWYLSRNRERLRAHAEQHMLEELDSERLRAALDELWDGLASMRLSEVFALVGESDIEDFVVLVYEFWLRYRKTEYFRRISTEGVDHFFVKYGQETLYALIEDMGVTEAMVSAELGIFLQPILDQAARTGALERLIRLRLEPFYASQRVKTLLGE
jgi:hypothetical protein